MLRLPRVALGFELRFGAALLTGAAIPASHKEPAAAKERGDDCSDQKEGRHMVTAYLEPRARCR